MPLLQVLGYPPTPAMKRFADSLVRQKGIKPPPGYKTSISICGAFLKQHAPKKADGEPLGKAKPSPAQLMYATKIALGKGVVVPEEAKVNSVTMAAWIDSNKGKKRRKSGRKTAFRRAGSIAAQSTAPAKISRKRKAAAVAAGASMPAQPNPVGETPLRIPFGNKDVAVKLGARYGSTGWYAPPGVDLAIFGERGWL
jgi:DNA topoisomerase-3